jgi:hypothetical protein
MCIARAPLIREHNDVLRLDAERLREFQKLTAQYDREDLERDALELMKARTARGVVDTRNVATIRDRQDFKTHYLHNLQFTTPLISGLTPCGDAIYGWPDDINDLPARLAYQNALIKQREEDKKRHHQFDEEEREYKRIAREREIADVEARRQCARQLKGDKIEDQAALLTK